MAGLSDQFVFIDRVRIQLNDRVQPQLGFIGEGRQDMEQVGHAAAGCLVEVGHAKQRTARSILRGPVIKFTSGLDPGQCFSAEAAGTYGQR